MLSFIAILFLLSFLKKLFNVHHIFITFFTKKELVLLFLNVILSLHVIQQKITLIQKLEIFAKFFNALHLFIAILFHQPFLQTLFNLHHLSITLLFIVIYRSWCSFSKPSYYSCSPTKTVSLIRVENESSQLRHNLKFDSTINWLNMVHEPNELNLS